MDEARGHGPIANVLQRLDDKIRAHIHTAVDITSGPKEIRTPGYPLSALQQLVRNAIMHGPTKEPTARYMFTGSMTESRSPVEGRTAPLPPATSAGPASSTTATHPGGSDALGLVQRYGAGIPIARKALLANDQAEPDFRGELGTAQ